MFSESARSSGLGILGGVAIFLVYSLFIAGIPYAAFMTASLLFLRKSSASTYRRFSLVAPAAFGGFISALFLILDLFETGGSPLKASVSNLVTSKGGLFLFALAAGYGYVAVVELARVSLKRSGVIHSWPAA
jgi:hypothetical protein